MSSSSRSQRCIPEVSFMLCKYSSWHYRIEWSQLVRFFFSWTECRNWKRVVCSVWGRRTRKGELVSVPLGFSSVFVFIFTPWILVVVLVADSRVWSVWRAVVYEGRSLGHGFSSMPSFLSGGVMVPVLVKICGLSSAYLETICCSDNCIYSRKIVD